MRLVSPLMHTAFLATVLPSVLAEAPRTPTDHVPRDGLWSFAAKLKPGAELTVAYLGGSITAGAGASSEEHCWRRAVHAWLERAYPEVRFTHVNAAKGGTGSALGVCRLGREVLAFKPDLVFVEFSVNDGGTPRDECVRTMEGIVRQVRRHDPATDIVILHTIHEGMLAQYRAGADPDTVLAFEEVADHYGVPSINLGFPVVRRIDAGELAWTDFTKDTCHPTDPGYKLFTDQIAGCLTAWLREPGPAARAAMPAPLDPNNWEDAGMIPLADCAGLTGGHVETDPKFAGFREYPSLLTLDKAGEELSFRFRGTSVGFYDVIGPDSGTIAYSVDGQDRGKLQLWDQWCEYYRSQAHFLTADLPEGEHSVTVRVLDEKAEKSTGHAVRLGFLLYRSGKHE